MMHQAVYMTDLEKREIASLGQRHGSVHHKLLEERQSLEILFWGLDPDSNS
tara:strand:- start:640 stop:792 length:153 start_codon:yes stop_codon:yes gene_type:complete